MKKKKQNKNIFITISYIALVAAIPATFIFSQLVGSNMERHIQHTMRNSAMLCAEMIERQYDSDMLLLEGLAMRMSTTLKSNPENGMERMVSTAERYGMKRIGFSTPDGMTITTDGVVLDLTGVDNFERAIKGESLLTSVIKDEADGEEVNIYSVPVYDEETGEIMGVISAVYYCDMFRDLLSVSTFDGEGYTYIMDSRGNIVIDSNHPNAILSSQNHNIFTYMHLQKQAKRDIAQIGSNLQNREEGFWEIESDKGDRFAYYVPIKVNDWHVFTVVPKNVAEETKNAVMFSIMVYCIGISLIAIYVVLSIRQSQREKNRLLKKALYEDNLTGGITLEKFRIDCRERLQKEKEKKAVCGFIDIDNFSLVSTIYGTAKGDEAIRQIYEIIQNCVGENGIVCRNGSNQFMILFFYEDVKEMSKSISQFNMQLDESAIFENMLRPSIGIYVVENPTEDIESMMSKAKIAHETIKQNSKSTIAYYDESFRNAKYADKHFEDAMELALKKHEFVPYFQPKYNAGDGTICGAEALIRWITPEGKVISPGRFIPLAENTGFIRMLDREMFAMVCRVQKNLLEQGITPVPVSVNVSRQLMYDKGFVDDYYRQMKEMGLPTDLVQLEITESVLFEDLDLFRETLEKLREYGFRILMDDFGTGYSSLMMLKSVPIDEIKLDKTFVDDYSDAKGSSIIRCVLDLAKMLELPVVAEGVETENQYKYLKQMGCDVIQGYYFSKPLPVGDYVDKLA